MILEILTMVPFLLFIIGLMLIFVIFHEAGHIIVALLLGKFDRIEIKRIFLIGFMILVHPKYPIKVREFALISIAGFYFSIIPAAILSWGYFNPFWFMICIFLAIYDFAMLMIIAYERIQNPFFKWLYKHSMINFKWRLRVERGADSK